MNSQWYKAQPEKTAITLPGKDHDLYNALLSLVEIVIADRTVPIPRRFLSPDLLIRS